MALISAPIRRIPAIGPSDWTDSRIELSGLERSCRYCLYGTPRSAHAPSRSVHRSSAWVVIRRPRAPRVGTTELKTRRELQACLNEAVSAARLHDQDLSLLLLGVDRFQDLTGTHGPRTGEEVLRKLGHELQRALRATDTFGGWEGAAFLVILPRTGGAGAVKSAERLRSRIAELRSDVEDQLGLSLTVTVGVAQWGGESQEDLIRRAETALSAGKASGGNSLSSADPRSLRAADKMVRIG